jgi:intracellular sulfur oxidation DsrE/DsrF family protein
LLWYVLLLATAGIVVYAVWSYRRGTAARKAASEARFEKMLKAEAQLAPGAQPPSSSAAETSAPAKPAPAASTAPPVAVERFLGKSESLLYYLLKAGLPDAEVFAGVSLARVVGVAGEGRDREQQLRRLSQYQLDFVVCDKSMRVVAVVEVESAAGATAAGDQRFKADMLKQAGIRLVRVNPAALPRRDEVRALINGGPVQEGAS